MQCSKSCDTGVATRQVDCVNINANGRVVDDSFCVSVESRRKRRHRRSNERRPSSLQRRRVLKPKTTKKCNKFPCPYQWLADSWSEVRLRLVAELQVSVGNLVQSRPVNCFSKELLIGTSTHSVWPGYKNGSCIL